MWALTQTVVQSTPERSQEYRQEERARIRDRTMSHSRGSRLGSPHPKPAVGPMYLLNFSEPLNPHLEGVYTTVYHLDLCRGVAQAREKGRVMNSSVIQA